MATVHITATTASSAAIQTPVMGPDGVAALVVLFASATYFLFATVDLITLRASRRRLPEVVRTVYDRLVAGFPASGRATRRTAVEYLTVTVVTLVPLFGIATAHGLIPLVRASSLVAFILAIAWTVYLVLAVGRVKRDV